MHGWQAHKYLQSLLGQTNLVGHIIGCSVYARIVMIDTHTWTRSSDRPVLWNSFVPVVLVLK